MTIHSPTLSSLVDIHAFYSRYSQVVGRATNSKDGKEWHGSCPRCGGHDRFMFTESGRFSCSIRSSGCGVHGSSPYWFLRDIEGLTHRQACEDLNIDLDQFEDWQEQHTRVLPLFMTSNQEPTKKWQDAANAFCQRAEKYLWSDKGTKAVAYVHSRGLSDETIKYAHIGLCPGWYHENLESWGLTQLQTLEETDIKIPEGIVIPHFVSGKCWKISIRRPDKSYFQVLGSSDCIFNIDSMQPGMAVMLVESELDALSVHQVASDIIASVATGGASKGQSQRWITALKQAPGVLLGFDADEAGENGAQSWIKKLSDALRWKPWAHDCNDMLRDKQHLRTWVEMGLRALHTQIEQPIEIVPEPIQEPVTPAMLPVPETPTPTFTKRKAFDPWIPLNDVGMPLYCSQCKNKAIVWQSNCSELQAFCKTHKP